MIADPKYYESLKTYLEVLGDMHPGVTPAISQTFASGYGAGFAAATEFAIEQMEAAAKEIWK